MRRCHFKAMPRADDFGAAIRSFSEPALCGRMNWKATSVHWHHVDCKSCLSRRTPSEGETKP